MITDRRTKHLRIEASLEFIRDAAGRRMIREEAELELAAIGPRLAPRVWRMAEVEEGWYVIRVFEGARAVEGALDWRARRRAGEPGVFLP
jgi:hypothetical protein